MSPSYHKVMKDFLRDESGQTIVEFVLLAAVSITVVAVLKNSIRNITVRLWAALGKRIAAPCPDMGACAPGAEFNL